MSHSLRSISEDGSIARAYAGERDRTEVTDGDGNIGGSRSATGPLTHVHLVVRLS
jgi:hypothetical protein